MLFWEAFWKTAIALFTVFGFYCALRTFLELLYTPSAIAVAVEVQTREDADMLDMLLHEAESAFLRKGRVRLVVLLSTALMDGTVGFGEELLEEYEALLDRYGAECYLIEPGAE